MPVLTCDLSDAQRSIAAALCLTIHGEIKDGRLTIEEGRGMLGLQTESVLCCVEEYIPCLRKNAYKYLNSANF